ncbi:dihydrodipicolinate synthase family protein [Paenibacillus sp. FSL H7-0331]|uniref:dihydrodipicolinate synthase family protein n=1 Tax=Paenibacillus sp. FSL H7-0331 TaxID=1920421 RepID=UPI00096F12AA|nr:dihydrodipicolinate synthase family protein [Paenibacillus sp. FSL H7-0331]OMF07271.1 dihydrodipicolinate synthase family protein [Paenibacillus sp. FSL H7-0331]
MKHLYGVTTAMVTPFDEQGNVQIDKVEELTEFLISKGVHCLYPLGTTGEMLRLSVEERKKVAQAVVKKANQRVTVYIHVGAMNEEETIALAKHAYEIGADGIGVVTPVFFGANDKELETYFVNVASSVPDHFPVYLYSIPQCAANDIKPDVAQRVADQCKNVIGIKYSYPDFLRVNEYLTVNQGDFSVVPGADRLFLPALAMGCEGVVSGVSCVYPEPFVAVYNAYKANDLDKARKMQRLATQFCEALKSGSNMSYFKEALKLRGVDAGLMKAPQLNITSAEITELEAVLKKLEQQAAVLLG